jgi:hypothetical protein
MAATQHLGALYYLLLLCDRVDETRKRYPARDDKACSLRTQEALASYARMLPVNQNKVLLEDMEG